MDDADRHALVQQLGQEMSDISEDCYCAGWLGGTEYLVPELCRRAIRTGRPFYWGHGCVTPERARALVALADRAGSWADLDEPGVGFVPFQPFSMPVEYVEAVEREQSSRYARSQSAGSPDAEPGAAADPAS